jgi:aconitase A
MGRTKKIIIIAVSVAVVLALGIGGVVLAADNQTSGQTKPGEALFAKACEIYQQKTGVAIDQAALKDAFQQAGSEIQKEMTQTRLQNLVTQGKITQDEADQMQNWLEARPKVNAPFGSGFGFRGHGGFPGRGGPCFPPPPAPPE